jgi:hypothetical protein
MPQERSTSTDRSFGRGADCQHAYRTSAQIGGDARLRDTCRRITQRDRSRVSPAAARPMAAGRGCYEFTSAARNSPTRVPSGRVTTTRVTPLWPIRRRPAGQRPGRSRRGWDTRISRRAGAAVLARSVLGRPGPGDWVLGPGPGRDAAAPHPPRRDRPVRWCAFDPLFHPRPPRAPAGRSRGGSGRPAAPTSAARPAAGRRGSRSRGWVTSAMALPIRWRSPTQTSSGSLSTMKFSPDCPQVKSSRPSCSCQ